MSLLPVDRITRGTRSVVAALPDPMVVVRLSVFMFCLLLVMTGAWMVGRATNPPVPIPDLPRPSVFGGPGSAGHDGGPALVHPGAP